MMAKLIKKTKSSIGKIHWPSAKETVGDTAFTVIVASVLAVVISLWLSGIEIMVNWVMSLL
jgi:preprotein translocase subunit SecE